MSDLRVEITVEHLIERGVGAEPYSRKSVTAVLRDGRGRAIERDDVRVELNGSPLQFRVSQGNYYDRHPYYTLADDSRISTAPGAEYHFFVVLPDGTRHEAGTVRMPAALEPSQFTFPRARPAGEAVLIAWRDLGETAAMTVFRSDIVRAEDGSKVHEAGSVNDPAALRRSIGPRWFRGRDGRWEIPAAFLADRADRKLSALGAEITIVHAGTIAKTLAKESKLVAERRLTLRMECEKPE